ncbi:ribosome small subunit-dependent GTPase A [Bacillus alkalicellulosilyticus]|uniref:ribosome small subunit-dependent GTPase A n=1 Tax=Alkalihalobacterium alkalicellulosilyticum TaxID=1912214 RepID=UPI00099747B0|nr:ribosome small subunit-dependent GTPase A [Bacillus alkalicellulosilyticus]
MEGKIVKALSGFYYVQNADGLFQCRGRGNFRKRKITPLVGDLVEFDAENATDGYILEVFDRFNEIVRPPIANVDQAILVFSAQEPDFSPLLLNRFLVHIEAHQIEPVIVISKADLLSDDKNKEIFEYKQDYEDIGYDVIITSTVTEEGIDSLLPYFDDKVTVIAGQSGVGKSSLLNSIRPELNIETNQISSHLGRGKHTTRHVELISIGTGLVADTPGFSSLDFTTIEAEDLSLCFPEMKKEVGNCKFRGCTHTSEPKCAVKEARERGEIKSYRYEHYLEFLEEIKTRKRRY